jgi:A/G-specific adenine glycosylase
MSVGEGWEDRYLWHRVGSPFWKLIAEILLTKTTRVAAERVLERLMRERPNPESVAAAGAEGIWPLISELGLRKRTLAVVEAARMMSERSDPPSPDEVKRLPYVGDYIADAYALYALSEPTFPLDTNIERLLYRSLLGVDALGKRTGPRKRRRSDPYKNESLLSLKERMCEGLSVPEVKTLHQGALLTAWSFCRAKPRCECCPLEDVCLKRSSETSPQAEVFPTNLTLTQVATQTFRARKQKLRPL